MGYFNFKAVAQRDAFRILWLLNYSGLIAQRYADLFTRYFHHRNAQLVLNRALTINASVLEALNKIDYFHPDVTSIAIKIQRENRRRSWGNRKEGRETNDETKRRGTKKGRDEGGKKSKGESMKTKSNHNDGNLCG